MIVDYKEVKDTSIVNAPRCLSSIWKIPTHLVRCAATPCRVISQLPAFRFVVGAKKGFPNFNEFVLLNDLMVSRKLEFHRNVAGGPIVRTNQTYSVGISNAFGIETWNSYRQRLPARRAAYCLGRYHLLRNQYERFCERAVRSTPREHVFTRFQLRISLPGRLVPIWTNGFFRRSVVHQLPLPDKLGLFLQPE